LRRIEDEPVHLVGVLRGVHAHKRAAPGPGDEIELRDVATLEHVLDRSLDFAQRHVGSMR
jgi:hypothetical protein